MGSKIECALIHEDPKKKLDACVNPEYKCMHRIKSKCQWVDGNDKHSFAQRRGVSIGKFTSEAKKGATNIRILTLIDGFYEHIKETFSIYPSKTDNSFKNLDFPFNYDLHYWTKLMIEKAVDPTVIESYSEILPTKSSELFLQVMDELQAFFEYDN